MTTHAKSYTITNPAACRDDRLIAAYGAREILLEIDNWIITLDSAKTQCEIALATLGKDASLHLYVAPNFTAVRSVLTRLYTMDVYVQELTRAEINTSLNQIFYMRGLASHLADEIKAGVDVLPETTLYQVSVDSISSKNHEIYSISVAVAAQSAICAKCGDVVDGDDDKIVHSVGRVCMLRNVENKMFSQKWAAIGDTDTWKVARDRTIDHKLSAVIEAGIKYKILPNGFTAYAPEWVEAAIDVYYSGNGFAGLTLAEYLAKTKPSE